MATFDITRIPFTDAIDRIRLVFSLVGQAGDPIADRLHVEAEGPTNSEQKPQVSNDALVKQAVIDGALTVDEGTALKSTLGKLVNYLLADYD
jgi:hypothetical protein